MILGAEAVSVARRSRPWAGILVFLPFEGAHDAPLGALRSLPGRRASRCAWRWTLASRRVPRWPPARAGAGTPAPPAPGLVIRWPRQTWPERTQVSCALIPCLKVHTDGVPGGGPTCENIPGERGHPGPGRPPPGRITLISARAVRRSVPGVARHVAHPGVVARSPSTVFTGERARQGAVTFDTFDHAELPGALDARPVVVPLALHHRRVDVGGDGRADGGVDNAGSEPGVGRPLDKVSPSPPTGRWRGSSTSATPSSPCPWL